MAYENVRSTGIVTVEENNEWRYGAHTDDGTVSVTLNLDTFNTTDEALRNKYFTGLGDRATTIYIKSGIPLAKIDATGEYGPYDPTATDGRQNKIAGLLESMLTVNVYLSGLELADGANAGMRYRGDIVKSKLPVVPADDAVWGGMFFDVEDDVVTPLSEAKGAAASGGATTVTSASISDASTVGKNVLTAKDAAAARTAIGAGTSSFTGSYNDLSNKPTIPAAYTLPAATATVIGGVKKAAAVANVGAADAKAAAGATPTQAEFGAVVTAVNEIKSKFNTLLTNGRTAGFLA
ncbi:hypothetical protein [Bifidobacterium sp. SO1]|uniref:hypothetical protein n=1 Tax=Bifidobacterium sp. SO1 TaxID=2809029 RepID=UPI001F0B1BCA|nr:hypothetical protein [Bifidobacterium sp. SO1]